MREFPRSLFLPQNHSTSCSVQGSRRWIGKLMNKVNWFSFSSSPAVRPGVGGETGVTMTRSTLSVLCYAPSVSEPPRADGDFSCLKLIFELSGWAGLGWAGTKLKVQQALQGRHQTTGEGRKEEAGRVEAGQAQEISPVAALVEVG